MVAAENRGVNIAAADAVIVATEAIVGVAAAAAVAGRAGTTKRVRRATKRQRQRRKPRSRTPTTTSPRARVACSRGRYPRPAGTTSDAQTLPGSIESGWSRRFTSARRAPRTAEKFWRRIRSFKFFSMSGVWGQKNMTGWSDAAL